MMSNRKCVPWQGNFAREDSLQLLAELRSICVQFVYFHEMGGDSVTWRNFH